MKIMMLLHVVLLKTAVELVLYCLMAGSLAWFLQECMRPKMIMRRYYLRLMWLRRKLLAKDTSLMSFLSRGKRRKVSAVLLPLGLCVYCNGTWLYIIFYFFFFTNIPLFILGMGVNYIFIELMRPLILWLKIEEQKSKERERRWLVKSL